MSTVQKRLKSKLLDKLVNFNRGSIKTHKSLQKLHHDVNILDHERDIVIFVAYIDDNDDKFKNVYNLRIKKKNQETGEFEFVSYKERVKYESCYYNQREGHLIFAQKKKLLFFKLSANFDTFEKFQEINLDDYDIRYLLKEYNTVLNGFVTNAKEESINIFTFTKNQKYEILQNFKPQKLMGKYNSIGFQPTTKNLVLLSDKKEIEIWVQNPDSQKYEFSWYYSYTAIKDLDINYYDFIFDKNGLIITIDSLKSIQVLKINYKAKKIEKEWSVELPLRIFNIV